MPFSNRVLKENCVSFRTPLSVDSEPCPLFTSPHHTALALRSMLSPLFPNTLQEHSDDQHGRTAISPMPHPDRDLRHGAVPRWRVQPLGNSNSRRTRQRFDSFRALAQASLAQASNANESPAGISCSTMPTRWKKPSTPSLKRPCARSPSMARKHLRTSELHHPWLHPFHARTLPFRASRKKRAVASGHFQPNPRRQGSQGDRPLREARPETYDSFLQDEAARNHASFGQFAGLNCQRLAGF